jgi:hypothetical protein
MQKQRPRSSRTQLRAVLQRVVGVIQETRIVVKELRGLTEEATTTLISIVVVVSVVEIHAHALRAALGSG